MKTYSTRMTRWLLAAWLGLALAIRATGCARVTPPEEALLRTAEAAAGSLAESELPGCPQGADVHALAGELRADLAALRVSLTERSWARALLSGWAGGSKPEGDP